MRPNASYLRSSAAPLASTSRVVQAVTFADIPVMAAYLCLIALIFVTINLVVDLLYFAVDPRLRIEQAGGH